MLRSSNLIKYEKFSQLPKSVHAFKGFTGYGNSLQMIVWGTIHQGAWHTVFGLPLWILHWWWWIEQFLKLKLKVNRIGLSCVTNELWPIMISGVRVLQCTRQSGGEVRDGKGTQAIGTKYFWLKCTVLHLSSQSSMPNGGDERDETRM